MTELEERDTIPSTHAIPVRKSRRAEVDWTIAERFSMLRHSVAKAEAVFATIITLQGFHILTFDHTNDPIAKAMASFIDYLPMWGLTAVCIGILQMCGAYFRVHSLREWSTFANLGFTLFAWIALMRSHTWTPGILVYGGYAFWLFDIFCYLRNTDSHEQLPD